jgi:sec-independent protein translocase protein TatA
MFGLRAQELLIIFGIVLLLFGATRLPALGKSLGAGIRNFKKGLAEDDAAAERPEGEKPHA